MPFEPRRELIGQFHGVFGTTPPFDMELPALGHPAVDGTAAHSPDAELQPDGKGGSCWVEP